MLGEAQRLGTLIVAAEARLDEVFESGEATAEMVGRLTQEVAHLQGARRAVHLNAHLEQVRILSADQVRRYTELRATARRGIRPTGSSGTNTYMRHP
jgi:hypothetical protein